MLIPTVVQGDGRNERVYDIYSRLLNERIIFINSDINETVSGLVTAQLLHLEAEDDQKPVNMYINSPGGSVYAGMAIIDYMNFIKCPVKCIASGLVASMGAVIFSSGEKGERIVLPNSRIMIHQVSGGFQGQASDIVKHAEEAKFLNQELCQILSDNTGQPLDKIKEDVERDFFLGAKESIKYGIADKMVSSRRKI